jgi:hypothetical protein
VDLPQLTWEDVLTQIINDSHLVTGDQLSAMVDRAVRPFGLTAEVLVVDLAQRALTPVRPQPGIPVAVKGASPAGLTSSGTPQAPKAVDDCHLAAIHAAQADALPRCRARPHHEPHVRQRGRATGADHDHGHVLRQVWV